MLDPFLRPLIDPPLARMAASLARAGLTANMVTVAAFACGLTAAACAAWGPLPAALALLLVNRAGDGLDGALARRAGATDLGGYLDIVLDFITYAALVFGFAVREPAANALPAAFLLLAFMGTGSSFLAFAVMAAKRGLVTRRRGAKSIYYLGGLAEGTETILFLVLACLLPASFPVMAWTFGTMCWLTTVGRVLTAVATLAERPSPEAPPVPAPSGEAVAAEGRAPGPPSS